MRKREFMPEKQFKTIAEIDAELERQLDEAKKAPAESEETDETVEAAPVENEDAVDTVEETPEEGQPEEKESEPTEEPTPQETKVQKEDKKDYAFKKLREEAETAKKELTSKKQVLSEIEILAKSQGFDTVDEFLNAWKEKQIEAEAKKQNIDPRVLKELQDTKERLAKIEREKNEAVQQSNINRVNTTISRFASTNKISEDDIQKIISKMGDDNLTVDMLVTTPTETLEKMLTGYAQDIIIERKVQERLSSLEKNGTSPAPEKHKNTVTSKKPDPFSKEALEDEMETFRKQNYPWLK
jgi:hypothetical protein